MVLSSALFLVGSALGCIVILFTILRTLPWGKDWQTTWP